MNKEEIVRNTQGKKTYQAPLLSVYGRVSHLTSSGSGTALEGNFVDQDEENGPNGKLVPVKDWRP